MPKGQKLEGSAAAVGFEYCNRLFAIEKELQELSLRKNEKRSVRNCLNLFLRRIGHGLKQSML
jgi:hypothetical protein